MPSLRRGVASDESDESDGSGGSGGSGVRGAVEVVVPGSAMLMGEHAVLRGYSCLVCAVNRFIRVRGTLTANRRLRIRSVFGEYDESLDALRECSDFRFVLAVIKRWFLDFDGGVELLIEADFSHEVGFGSSAAVTVAVELVCRALLGESTESVDVLPAAVGVIRAVQGCGSGADVAASLFGGVLVYDADTLSVRCIAQELPISFWYSGYKTSTSDVIQYVSEREERYPGIYLKLFQAMGMVTNSARDALVDGDRETVGQLMNIYQGLMESLGVSDGVLGSMVLSLRRHRSVYGAKISGSGLGDCVVALHRSVSGCSADIDVAGHYLDASVSPIGASFNTPDTTVS